MASDELSIRRADAADAPAITEIYNEAILTTTATFDLEPKTTAERARWLEAHTGRFPVLVAEIAGEVVGWAALTAWSDRAAYADTAETALYVHSRCRNQGIGRRLKQALIDEARRQRFHTLIARVTEDSEVSIHLNRSFGFAHVGTLREVGRKFGRWLDVLIMQKLL